MKPIALLLAAALFVPHLVYAEDFGKTAVAEALMAQAKADARDSDRPASRVTAKSENTPYIMQEAMPADVDQLMARVSEQNAAIVEEYQALLQKDPLNAQAPHWLEQIAEFHWQMAHYDYLRARRAWMAGMESCDIDAGTCPPEPQADYSQAIADYRKILQQYPTYEKMDNVLFRLGDALIRNQQSKEGVGYLHRLIQSYPDFKDLDAAYLAMGEFYFSQKNTGTAQAAYTKIVETWPDSSFYQYAQYKLAWTYLNLADDESYRMAISLFKSVVESIDVVEGESDGQIDENRLNIGVVTFRNQALNDLSVTYAELPDGWKEARDYLKSKLPPDKARTKLKQLASILDDRAKYEESIVLYDELLAESPNAPDSPELMKRQIGAYIASNRMQEADEAREKMVAAMLPKKAWMTANAADEALCTRVSRDNAQTIYQLAMKELVAGSESEDRALQLQVYARAESWLALYLDNYPDGVRAFEVTFSHAFVMDEQSDYALSELRSKAKKDAFTVQSRELLPRLEATAAEYQKIIDWAQPQDDDQIEQIKVAANRQVFVYANILATEDPTWSVVNSAKTQRFVEEKRDSATLEEIPLTSPETAFVSSAEQYASRYPDDEETPAFLWRAAEIYRTKYHYNQAAERFDAIITHFPDHQYAAVSVGSMFELYNKARNYEKIEYWAAWLIDKKNFRHYTKTELEEAAAYAIDAQAASSADKGEFAKAGETILRIRTTYPERADLIVPAYIKSIRYAESDHNYVTALDRASALMALDLDSETRATVSFMYGENAVRLARFALAANAFESSAALRFEKMTKSEDSKLASAKNIKSSKKSKSTTKSQSKMTDNFSEKSRVEAARAVLFGAQILSSLGEKSRSAALLDNYIKANQEHSFDLYKDGEDFVVLTKEEVSQKTDAALVLDNTKAALVAAAIESPAIARARLETCLGEKPDVALHDDEKQLAFALYELAIENDWPEISVKMAKLFNGHDAAFSAYEQARVAYLDGRRLQRDFERVQLEFPVRTLKKRIEEKAKLRQSAEKSYRAAIAFKNPHVATAAAYQLAQMALSFRDAFRALPMPDELANDPDAQDEYTMWLEDELIYPAEDAASQLLGMAQELSVQLGAHTPFALKTAQTLAGLQPDQFPVSKSSQ